MYGNALTYSMLVAIILGAWSYATTDSFNLKYYQIKEWIFVGSVAACWQETPRKAPDTERTSLVRDRKEDRNEEQAIQKKPIQCNVKCKVEKLIDAGIKQDLAVTLVNECKWTAKDPIHCIKVWASIAWAESTGGKVWNNPFGYRNKSYKNEQEAVSAWIKSYNRYWFTATNAHFFYPTDQKYPAPSRFCTDESWSGNACPRWNKNFTTMWNKLTF